MSVFSNKYGSKFPNNSSITLHNFENISTEIVNSDRYKEVNALRISGDDESAQKKIVDYGLRKYIADALIFNLWEEEINNAQTYVNQIQQNIYFGVDIPDCLEGDTWIAGDSTNIDSYEDNVIGEIEGMTFFSDVKLSNKSIMDEYDAYVAQGKYDEASEYIEDANKQGKIYSYSAYFYNLIENKIKAVQDYLLNEKVKQSSPFKYSEEKPIDIEIGEFWL